MYCNNQIMKNEAIAFLSTLLLSVHAAYPQEADNSTPGEESRDSSLPVKVSHAEPLYIDLIRDLGARKGEKEWNVGMGMTDNLHFDSYEYLVEYEWAPIDRLGLEVEIPVTIYSKNSQTTDQKESSRPSNRIESLKAAYQYTFLVSDRRSLSMAIGSIVEAELNDLETITRRRLLHGMVYNPFVVLAKSWGRDLHTLVYTGPKWSLPFDGERSYEYAVNSNIHYMIPGTRNFAGVEFNKSFKNDKFSMIIRPQMRLTIKDNLLLGVVPGIPVAKDNQRLSAFLRLIYEPGHQH